MGIKLPKINSEDMYFQYFLKRQSLIHRSKYELLVHSKLINELNLRIIEWNCRNDKVNPVQIDEKPESH